MTPQQVIDHYGSQSAAARALGIKQPAIAQWLIDGKVPPVRQYQVAHLTGLPIDPLEPTPTPQEASP